MDSEVTVGNVGGDDDDDEGVVTVAVVTGNAGLKSVAE